MINQVCEKEHTLYKKLHTSFESFCVYEVSEISDELIDMISMTIFFFNNMNVFANFFYISDLDNIEANNNPYY